MGDILKEGSLMAIAFQIWSITARNTESRQDSSVGSAGDTLPGLREEISQITSGHA